MITLQNEHLRIEISPEGAEVQRITDANGYERLWDGDPAFWPGHSPVLFPVCGSLREGRYRLDGKDYALEKHGFARRRTFAVEAQSDAAVTFLLTHAMGEEAGFPFPYAFRVRYELEGDTLHVAFRTDNLGDAPFWYGVGAHEAYACPGEIETYELVFDEAETLEHNLLDGPLLTGDLVPVPMQGNILPIREALFENDSLVFDTHRSRGITLRSTAHPREVRVTFADFDGLLLWRRPGAAYLCIEPWTNLPDRVDADGDIAHKPGMIRLAPGETRTHAHSVRFTG